MVKDGRRERAPRRATWSCRRRDPFAGDPDALRRRAGGQRLGALGIRVVAALEGVGAGLQNHPVVYLATHVAPAARQSPLIRPQFNAGSLRAPGAT